MAAPVVYGFGSCRIHTPLRRAAEHQGVRYRRNTCVEFYHNTAEIRQIAAFLAGRQELMFALAPYMSMVHPLRLFDGAAEDFQYFREADMYVVEISTIKLCLYRGHQLQLVRLRDFLAEQMGMEEDRLHQIYAQPELAKAIRLPKVETDEEWLAQDILETAQFSLQTAEGLEADLRALHAQLGKPVLYVSHFVHLPDGTPVAQRELIRGTLARVVPTLEGTKAAFFDPTPVTAEGEGYAVNLADQGHYTEAFDLRMGAALAKQIQDFIG